MLRTMAMISGRWKKLKKRLCKTADSLPRKVNATRPTATCPWPAYAPPGPEPTDSCCLLRKLVLANAISHQFRQVRTVRTIVRPHSTEYFFQVSSLTRLKNLNSQAKVFSIKTGFSEIFKRERKKKCKVPKSQSYFRHVSQNNTTCLTNHNRSCSRRLRISFSRVQDSLYRCKFSLHTRVSV
jgi:hypothetical protein